MKTKFLTILSLFVFILSAPSCSILNSVLNDTGTVYTGRVGCNNPMADTQFQSYRNTIQQLNNEIIMKERVESSLPGRCIWTSQLRQLAMMFNNEIFRKDIIILGYDSVHDLDNYTELTSCVQNTFFKEEILDRAGF